jgi:hypothetical protein
MNLPLPPPPWGCKHCPARFESLSEAMIHARDVHGVDPFGLLGMKPI